MKKIYTKSFSLKECELFSKQTGDLNILHLDRKIKNISQFEKPVVQGVLVLRTLLKKNFLKEILGKSVIIHIIFKKPIFINEKITFFVEEKKKETLIIGSNFFQDKILIRIEIANNKNLSNKKIKIIREKNDVEGLLSALQNVSKKVGNFKKELNLITTISISVTNRNVNKTIKLSNNLYRLTISNKDISIETYFINFPKKFIEKKFNKSKITIDKKKYENSKILVIGGSSGLGKILTTFFLDKKLKVDFTYNVNINSAKKIQKQYKIKSDRFFEFNDKKFHILNKKISEYKYIYFFPTPKIFNFNDKYFDYKKFTSFNSINISLILKIVNILAKSKKKYVLYIPSTKLINNFDDNIEYNLSKFMQELILKKVNRNFKNINILNPRLESYLTRSTKGLINNKLDYDNFLQSAIGR